MNKNSSLRHQPGNTSRSHSLRGLVAATLGAAILSGCSAGGVKQASAPLSPKQAALETQDLQIVDCLLPGQMRYLGGQSYLTPRRPTRTTAADCRVRGGEYVAFDRADYKTALAVWMQTAESGDPKAQVNVGEIYERGYKGEPNYPAAAIWYEKAAKQGNRQAMFNLGTLYEQGKGVKKDKLAALNWYRKAWGLPADDVIFQSAIKAETSKVEAQLKKQIQKSDRRIKLLESQVKSLSSKSSGDKEQIRELQNMINELKTQKQTSTSKLDNVIRLRQPVATAATVTKTTADAKPVSLGDKKFGRYFALVIGNQHYQNMNDLVTPISDVNRISQILHTRYGFTVTQLHDSSNIAIMDAINNLNEELGDNDNLLIYYAGHGSRSSQSNIRDISYWLPVNADPPPRDTLWVSSEFITRHLGHLKAKRVLVVSDSCFSGLLSDAPGFLFLNESQVKPDANYLTYKLPRRSRLLLASGGNEPVLDNGGGNHSVFAKAFIDVLENNKQLMTAPEVYLRVKKEVERETKKLSFKQEPVYNVIKGAGHEVGDFFFVPVNAVASSGN